jgi:hypothetical protein
MAKKKKKAPARRSARKAVRTRSGLPDISVLSAYSPDDPGAHPAWVKTNFPSYIADQHAGHETTAVREMAHQGHVVRIYTTYRVEVDGEPIRAHLSVDEDGRVYTHATPFVTYASALDLMRAVIDGYPDSFEGTPPDPHGDQGGHGDHGGHGEHGGHVHGHGGHQ